VLVDAGGNVHARAARPTPFGSHDGRVEMPVDALLGTVAAVISAVISAVGDRHESVGGVGVAAMAESGAPLGTDGRPTAPVIAWHDRRGEEAAERLRSRFGADLDVAIGQRVRAVLSVAKLAWLVDHGAGAVVRWLGVPELCLWALTDAQATEHSLAARTGCYDVTRKQWLPDVPTALGFDVGVFPEVLAAGTAMGAVSRQGSERFGIPAGIPVTIAGHDHLSGMTGAGVRLCDAANSVGTAETVLARTARAPDVRIALDRSLAVTVFPGGTEWVVLASAVRAGRVLDAVAARLGRSPADLDVLAARATNGDAAVPPGFDVADLLDPIGHGEPAPLPEGDPGAVWASFLSALVSRTEGAWRRVSDVAGPSRRLVVFGGGSTSEPWVRAKAATLPVPVWRSSAPDAAARGAALHAGVAARWWPDADAAPAAPATPVVP
jgi:xylulokinase